MAPSDRPGLTDVLSPCPMREASPPSSILFLGALWREVSRIASILEGARPLSTRAAHATEGRSSDRRVIVAAGGVGRDRITSAADEVLRLASTGALVHVGFAGAITPDVAPATLVLGEAILHNGAEAIPSPDLQAQAEDALRRAGTRYRKGRLLTVDRLLLRADEKREVGRRYAALAVEMEAYHLARLTEERGVPFICVKAIVDAVDQDLPDPALLLSPSGEPSILRAASYLLRRPREIGSVVSLARSDRDARRALAAFADSLVQEWETGETG